MAEWCGVFCFWCAGGAVGVVNPVLGAKIKIGGNIATDILTGKAPCLDNPEALLMYAGGQVLDYTGTKNAYKRAKTFSNIGKEPNLFI
ncbi:MAG: hypothetical protein OHK0053_28910 [Microscillaceae bacterium]